MATDCEEEFRSRLTAWRTLSKSEQLAAIAAEAETASPGLIRQALNLGRSVVGHLASGCEIAPADVQAARERACRACPKLDQARDVCTVCGCLLMRLKRSWASESCPEQRWPV